jgi:hypothetical protein
MTFYLFGVNKHKLKLILENKTYFAKHKEPMNYSSHQFQFVVMHENSINQQFGKLVCWGERFG